jgi:hypothetical protein
VSVPSSRSAGCGAATTTVDLRRSTDGVAWSGPVTTDLTQDALWPWHVDVEWIPSRDEFWAVYNVKTAYNPFTDAVTFWYSGARFEGSAYVWKAAVERRHRAEVFANLTSIEDGTLFTPPPAPLIDWP